MAKLNIEVFSSPGCTKCEHAKELLQQLAEDIAAESIKWREVNVLDEMDYAVELGVLTTPSMAINGELIFTSLPSAKKLRAELEKRLVSDSSEPEK